MTLTFAQIAGLTVAKLKGKQTKKPVKTIFFLLIFIRALKASCGFGLSWIYLGGLLSHPFNNLKRNSCYIFKVEL